MTFLLLMTPVPQSLILHKAFSFNNQKNKSDKKHSFSYSIPLTFLFYTMEDSPIVQYIIMRKVRTQKKRNIIELCFIGSYE